MRDDPRIQNRFRPDPNQPERCPSMDPYDSGLQCGRRIHDDDQCQFGGIAWKKGERYIDDTDRVRAVKAIVDEHADCACPTQWLLDKIREAIA